MAQARIDTQRLKTFIGNRWLGLLKDLCPALTEAILHWGKHVACPMHVGRNGDGFRLFEDADVTGGGYCNTCGGFGDGIKLLMTLNKWNFLTTVAAIQDWLQENGRMTVEGLDTTRPHHGTEMSDCPREPDPWALSYINHVIDNAEFYHPRLASYFLYRGLSVQLSDYLGYVNSVRYKDDLHDLRLPAMVACFQTPDGTYVGIHRTFLDPAGDGKADVPEPKKFSRVLYPGALSGSAIRLQDHTGVLGLAEGIETAMAVFQVTGTPTWSVGSAGGMATFIPPATVRQVDIWADNDALWVGQTAAAKLALRLLDAGIPTRVMIPPVTGTDWLDLLVTQGANPLRHAFSNAALFFPGGLISRSILFNLLIPDGQIPRSVFLDLLGGVQ